MGGVHAVQAVLLVLLTVVAVVAGLAKRMGISYPILLVVVGLGCSVIPHVPPVRLPPYVVFYIFLPPLLYAAAWGTSWREFHRNLVSVAMLSVGLVFFTAAGVALVARFFLPEFDWRLGFLLGAIASPTDAVAATSIARRVGMPQNIVDLLEGESLLNDATGLLALQFGLNMIVNGTVPTVGMAALELFWLLAGGVLVGLLCGVAVGWAEQWIDDGPIEIALSLLTAYGSYLAGEALHASGVIAVVVCGLYLSRKSAQFFSSEVRLQAWAVWETIEFLLNGLVFVLIGLQLPAVMEGIRGYSHARLAGDGAIFAGTLIALRLLWMFPAARVGYFVRTRLLGQIYAWPGPKPIFVLGWTGMRGVVALAAATFLPDTIADGRPLPERSMLIFLTFAVILVTLVGQGLTLPALIRRLGLQEGTDGKREEGEARQLLLEDTLQFLREARAQHSSTDTHAFDDLLHAYEHRLSELTTQSASAEQAGQDTGLRTLQMEALDTQRRRLMALRSEGRIGDAVYRTLERELDLGESRLHSATR